MLNKFNLWSSSIYVIDNYIEDNSLIETLKKESIISNTIEGQNKDNLSSAQEDIIQRVKISIISYCADNGIDFNSLKHNNTVKGSLNKYDETMVSNHLYEPHNDMAEGSYVTVVYYIDSSYDENNWCGGELTLYKHLTYVDFPQNIINILPKQNRLVIFPGFTTHRVKPYFGNKPRTTLVFGWSVDEPSEHKVITI